MKHSTGSQRNLVATSCALPASSFHNGVGCPVPASTTGETIRPATGGQIILAGFFGSELKLKFANS